MLCGMCCSIRAPRMGTRDRAPDTWATEAKEFLRKRLIGRDVEVKMEYTRKVPAVAGACLGRAWCPSFMAAAQMLSARHATLWWKRVLGIFEVWQRCAAHLACVAVQVTPLVVSVTWLLAMSR